MSVWALLKSVLFAVALSPFVAVLIGLALGFVSGKQSIQDSAIIVVGLPIVGSLLLILGGIPVLIGTTAVASALTFVQRHLWPSPILLWVVAVVSVVAIPYFQSRYPHGDGGTMQSMVENIKAMFAASIAIWCVVAALRPAGQA